MEAIKERGRQKILIEKDLFGTVRDKVKIAQERLKAFEPSEGYYVADSGGKDSACVLVLCKMAGVRFDSHYNITTIHLYDLQGEAGQQHALSSAVHGAEP